MSYALAATLQTALFEQLSSDAAVSALIGEAVYDATPSGTLPETYVLIGNEDVRDASDRETSAALHDFTLSVVSTAQGFLDAKKVAAAIGKSLDLTPLPLSEGHVVWLQFQKARARRQSAYRQIDLRYRAHVSQN